MDKDNFYVMGGKTRDGIIMKILRIERFDVEA